MERQPNFEKPDELKQSEVQTSYDDGNGMIIQTGEYAELPVHLQSVESEQV